jgi:hypothetical protein
MDWHELEKMKVTDLRELAKEKTQLTGVSGLHKADLVEALANELGIDKPHKVAQGAEKTKLKQKIRALKVQRDEAAAGKDTEAFRASRQEIHKLRRHLRRMAKLTSG